MECSEGMETPVSIFLLIIAAGLILSTIPLDRSSSTDDSEIFHIRMIQARSVGSSLIEYTDAGGNPLLISRFIECADYEILQILISPGYYNYSSDPEGMDQVVESIIFSTPDQLPLSILLYHSEMDIPPIDVDHASWRIDVLGVILEVSMPIHRVVVESLEVVC